MVTLGIYFEYIKILRKIFTKYIVPILKLYLNYFIILLKIITNDIFNIMYSKKLKFKIIFE